MHEFEFNEKKSNCFWEKYRGEFATPKKLNRSAAAVPAAFIDKLESGEATSADIVSLQNLVPVFSYKTCVTIHGLLPDIQRQRIGGYKNICQNKNGSLEIRYSAIDYTAKKAIADILRIGAGNGWHVQENSTNGIYFERPQTFDNKAAALSALAAARLDAENINPPGMLAKVSVYGFAIWGRYYVALTVYPLSITGEPVPIAAALTGQTVADLAEKVHKLNTERSEREQQYQQKAAAYKAAREAAISEAMKAVNHLPRRNIDSTPNAVFIRPFATIENAPAFEFIRVQKTGSFGRLFLESYRSKSFQFDASKFQPYMKGKQVKPGEISNTFLMM